MTDNNDITDADRELFRRSIGNVQKLKQDRVPVCKSRPAPVPVPVPLRRITNAHITEEMFTPPVVDDCVLFNRQLFFKRTGIQDKVMEKLRKGKFPIERELDLHGMNSTRAQKVLARFLDNCRQGHVRCVRIIHGKGRSSRDGKSVIKHKLNHWLRNIPQVLAFCSALAHDGGNGAIYVLLRRN